MIKTISVAFILFPNRKPFIKHLDSILDGYIWYKKYVLPLKVGKNEEITSLINSNYLDLLCPYHPSLLGYDIDDGRIYFYPEPIESHAIQLTARISE